MLDRLKLAAALDRVSSNLFPDVTDVIKLAWQTYQQCAGDATFVKRADEAQSSFLVPSWRGNLLDTYQIKVPEKPRYTVVAVDGSQIYPDRHVGGAGCFLINIGTVVLQYGAQSSVHMGSTPRVCMPDEVARIDEKLPFCPELVDLLREDDELSETVSRCMTLGEQQPVALIDGTIIFWNLEGKTPEVRRLFLQRYLSHLQKLYEARIPCAGYVSLPKSRELINLVKLGLCRFTTANCIPCHATYDTFPCKQVDALVDTHVVSKFLPVGSRSTLFASSSTIVAEYPAHLRPLFCYLNVGREIVRLEIPAWLADDEQLLNRICGVAWDQSVKGNGYPVALAEAHEQAVVKGRDREFFYQLIARIGMQSNKRLTMSQKRVRKRGAIF